MLFGMDKGDIKIKRKRESKEWVSFDPRISNDRKTFVLRVESSTRANWFEFMNAIYSYATEEMNRMMEVESEVQ